MEAGLPFIAEGEKEFKGSQAPEVSGAVSGWTVYHFHDTTLSAGLRREQPVQDYRILRHDASNIAAFLLGLRVCNKSSYDLIRDTVRQIAPFFDDFLLEVRTKGDEEKVRLEWRQKGSDFPFQAYHLSDGTLRFICLATALLQPVLPSTIVIDEPELGLHPYAIGLLASLAQSASECTQAILSTQSPALLDYFKPEDVIVVNRREGHSTFDRLNPRGGRRSGWRSTRWRSCGKRTVLAGVRRMSEIVAIVEGQTEQALVRDVPGCAPDRSRRRHVGHASRPGGEARRREGVGIGPGRYPPHAQGVPGADLHHHVRFLRHAGNWPGREQAAGLPLEQKGPRVEQAMLEDLSRAVGETFRPELFIPYVQVHEFEALLFSDPTQLAATLGAARAVEARARPPTHYFHFQSGKAYQPGIISE